MQIPTLSNLNFEDDDYSFIFGEFLAVSVILGFITGSWYVFGALLLGLFLTLKIPILFILLLLFLPFFWAYIVAVFARGAFTENMWAQVDGLWTFGRVFWDSVFEGWQELSIAEPIRISNYYYLNSGFNLVSEILEFLGGIATNPASIVMGVLVLLTVLLKHFASFRFDGDTDSEVE